MEGGGGGEHHATLHLMPLTGPLSYMLRPYIWRELAPCLWVTVGGVGTKSKGRICRYCDRDTLDLRQVSPAVAGRCRRALMGLGHLVTRGRPELRLFLTTMTTNQKVRWLILASYYFFSGISNAFGIQGGANICNAF